MPETQDNSDDVRTPLQKRGTLVTSLKNKSSYLEVLLFQGNKESINKHYAIFKNVYSQFIECIDTHMLDVDVDNEAIHVLFLNLCSKIDNFLNDKNDRALLTPIENINNSHINPTITKPSIFKGDSHIFYHWFSVLKIYLKGFKSWEEKFIVILELTEGKARDSISGFIYEQKSEVTVNNVLQTLKNQFGSEDSLLDNFLHEVEATSPFSDNNVDSLRTYINLLKRGLSMSKLFQSFEILNSRIYLTLLLSKLSDSLRERWVQLVLDHENPKSPLDTGSSETIGLNQLICFLEERLSLIVHPMYKRKSMIPSTCLNVVNSLPSDMTASQLSNALPTRGSLVSQPLMNSTPPPPLFAGPPPRPQHSFGPN